MNWLHSDDPTAEWLRCYLQGKPWWWRPIARWALDYFDKT